MNPWTTLTILGTPAPQGSKRHVGKGRMVESSKAVKPWREAIVWQCKGREMILGPVEIEIVWKLPKPKSEPKTRTTYPDRKPDIDKLLRSTLDGLKTAGIYEDDARVVRVRAEKSYIGQAPELLMCHTGAFIRVRRYDPMAQERNER